jgi:hypothetical protein
MSVSHLIWQILMFVLAGGKVATVFSNYVFQPKNWSARELSYSEKLTFKSRPRGRRTRRASNIWDKPPLRFTAEFFPFLTAYGKKAASARKPSSRPQPRKGANNSKPRMNTGRDSQGSATGPIIRTLPNAIDSERPRRSLLKKILIALVLVILVGFGWLTCKGKRSVAAETGTIKVEGISGTVTIARDAYGVPLVKAENEADAFFGAGYATANDRLWQMYASKLAVTGRLAEIAGSKMLPVDVYMRTVGIKRNVDRAINAMPAKYKPLEAYAAGVNAYLKANPNLPLELAISGYTPEPWTILDCGYVFGALVWSGA